MLQHKTMPFSKTAISMALAGALAAIVSALAHAAPPEARELPALLTAPDLPVKSIILRREFPDHPLPPLPEREVPGRGEPLQEGLPEPGGGGCDKDVDLTSTLAGVEAVAAQNNGICTSADIDTYEVAPSTTYVVQAGGEQAGWTHTDVSDPSNPVMVEQFVWPGGSGKATYTPDLKTFYQGANDYIVMGLERTKANGFCGVVIYDVTDPVNPVLQSQYIGSTSNQSLGPSWCDTHNVFVETDANGDGQYIYATADAPNDLRVLDIGGTQGGSVTDPVEIGRYVAPTANNNNYVHDITFIDHGSSAGRRVYLSYWDTGLVILDAAGVTPGVNPTPIVGPNVIDPGGFLTHHAWASEDGSLAFIQDEFLNSSGAEPVQMWDVSNPASPTHKDSLVLGSDVPVNPAHNLEIRFDIDPDRLYVGWYKLGLQAWDFDGTGFTRVGLAPRTAVEYHQVQTEASDGVYSGAWGVRLALIGAELYIFQSNRNFGLIVSCAGCSTTPTGSVEGFVTDTGGSPLVIENASVSSDMGQNDTTDSAGFYSLTGVPVGTRTITASATGYVTQEKIITVIDGGLATVDFALDPEATGGGTGTIKGTVRDMGGNRLDGAQVETGGGLSDGTNKRGMYRIKQVPEGGVSVTASFGDCEPLEAVFNLAAGQTVEQDFALVCP